MIGFYAAGAMGTGGGGETPGATPTFQAAGAGVASTNAIDVVWPAHAAGDLGILVVQTSNQAVGDIDGWTKFVEVGTGTAGAANSAMLTLFRRIAAGSSEPTARVTDSGDHQYAMILTFRGADAASPVETTATGSGSTSSIVLPSLTTTNGNRLIAYFIADGRDQVGSRFSSWASPSLVSITERADSGVTNSNGGGIGAASGEKSSAGIVAAGSVSFDLTATNYAAATVAIMPPNL